MKIPMCIKKGSESQRLELESSNVYKDEARIQMCGRVGPQFNDGTRRTR